MTPRDEIGSFFAWPTLSSSIESPLDWPDFADCLYTNTGRSALSVIVGSMQQEWGMRRVLVPTYYCWDVVEHLAATVVVDLYRCDPWEQTLPTSLPPDAAIIVNSYFGIEPPQHRLDPERVIVDITHDPAGDWLAGYPTGAAFASLRKTLPLPEGGVALSSRPFLHALADPSRQGRMVRGQMASAMKRKKHYISGADQLSDKAWYQVLLDAEEQIGRLPVERMDQETEALLGNMPVLVWRQRRLQNLHHLVSQLPRAMNYLRGATFGLTLVMSRPEEAESLQSHLIANRVFPARLWWLPSGQSRSVSGLDRRTLTIHTDHRYGLADMDRVAQVLDAW